MNGLLLLESKFEGEINLISKSNSQPLLLAVVLLSSLISGCISDSSDDDFILVVNYEQASGTVIQTFDEGELVSTTSVELEFDFSNSVSANNLVLFAMGDMFGSQFKSINPAEDSTITFSFSEHGIFYFEAYATDDSGRTKELTIVIRIDLEMIWDESGTYEPIPMEIDSIPDNGGVNPISMTIDSTVTNPGLIEDISGGREVDITWRLTDPLDDSCQVYEGVVHEGESLNWKTVHFNTYEVHELSVSYDDGQDRIDVHHVILIEYEELESEPNP